MILSSQKTYLLSFIVVLLAFNIIFLSRLMFMGSVIELLARRQDFFLDSLRSKNRVQSSYESDMSDSSPEYIKQTQFSGEAAIYDNKDFGISFIYPAQWGDMKTKVADLNDNRVYYNSFIEGQAMLERCPSPGDKCIDNITITSGSMVFDKGFIPSADTHGFLLPGHYFVATATEANGLGMALTHYDWPSSECMVKDNACNKFKNKNGIEISYIDFKNSFSDNARDRFYIVEVPAYTRAHVLLGARRVVVSGNSAALLENLKFY